MYVTSKTQYALTIKTLLFTLFSQNVNNIRHYVAIDLKLVSGNGFDCKSLGRRPQLIFNTFII